MAIYNPASLKAEEFINDEEIKATLAYAEANKNNIELIDSILEKARPVKTENGTTCKGLTHREASVLLACEIPEKIEKIYEIVGKESVVGSQNFYANEAASKSGTYFWISFVVMSIVALGALTVFIIALRNHTTMTFEWLVSRLSFFGVFLLLFIKYAYIM